MTDGDEQPPGRTTDGDEPRPTVDADRAADASAANLSAAADASADDTRAENAATPAGVDAAVDTIAPAPAPAPAPDAASLPHPAAGPASYPVPLVQPDPTRTVRQRRRWPLWTALGLALGLVAGAVPGVLLRESAPDAAGRSAANADPGTAAQRRLGERMLALLDRQAAALVGADRAGFLAVAEPAARPALSRRYAALRALRVTVWRPAADGVPEAVEGRPGEWRQTVTVGYCFVVPDCAPSTVELGARWRLAGEEPRLTALEPSEADPAGVRPWQMNDLAVTVGKRVVV
ncbi:hypothetical protein ACFWDZ_09130, partial [Micromonospora aurantiaca]